MATATRSPVTSFATRASAPTQPRAGIPYTAVQLPRARGGARIPLSSCTQRVHFGLSRRDRSVFSAASRRGLVVRASAVSLTSVANPSSPPVVELDKGSATLGSGANADVTLDGASVEIVHAKLEVKGGRPFLTDLDSEGGTYIDENKLMAGVAYILGSGSIVRLGGSKASNGLELMVEMPQVQVSQMDEMLAGAFTTTFMSGASDEVKKLLDDA